MGQIVLILGGAKSGKTGLALKRAEARTGRKVYLATAEAHDAEMVERIQRHKAERGPEWTTVEEPLDPAAVLRKIDPADVSVVLLDCLTLWLSNLMAGQGLSTDEAVDRVRGLAEAASTCQVPVLIVSNEVGQGIVPDNKLARDFRDAAGLGHQILAEKATEVVLVAAGLPLKLK